MHTQFSKTYEQNHNFFHVVHIGITVDMEFAILIFLLPFLNPPPHHMLYFLVLFMCYVYTLSYFSPSYSIHFRCWTGNVAATKMKWLFWWAGPSQVCTYCPHHCKCFSTNFKRHCIDLHHNYILQAFVLKMVICTSYFFINNFPSFVKAKIAFEIGLLTLQPWLWS